MLKLIDCGKASRKTMGHYQGACYEGATPPFNRYGPIGPICPPCPPCTGY